MDITNLQADMLDWVHRTNSGPSVSGIGGFFGERRTPREVRGVAVFHALRTGLAVDTNAGRSSRSVLWAFLYPPNHAYSLRLTEKGRAAVAARALRRANPALRWEGVQIALLRWLRERDPEGAGWTRRPGFVGSAYDYFEGEPFTPEEIGRAVLVLEERGLIRTVRRLLLRLSPD
jgi:hypothetical protein